MAQIATARHILVKSESECSLLKKKLDSGRDFAELASDFSSCPSAKNGGDLGQFSPGQMVHEFDKVVFHEDLGVIHGPVKTRFGYHLLEITSRESSD